MESKNNLIIVLLIVLIAVVGELVLLKGINNAVWAALGPLDARLASIEREQRNTEDRINAQISFMANIQMQMGQLQSRIAMGPGAGSGQQVYRPPMPEDMNRIYNIPVGISAVLGDRNAPVTITEFSDFQCPYCAAIYPVIKDVLAAYPGKVKVVVKNFPLPMHPNSHPAAKLAMAANEQGKFQGMMELLLANGGDVSDAKIKEYAQKLGLDYAKLMADYTNKDSQWNQQIQQDMSLGSAVDVRGTPSFYINGRKTNARDLASFKSQIDQLLGAKG